MFILMFVNFPIDDINFSFKSKVPSVSSLDTASEVGWAEADKMYADHL